MAQTDYVSRGRKPRKKTPKKPPTPWARIIAAVLFVCGFVFGLYKLQSSADVAPDELEQRSIEQNAQGSSAFGDGGSKSEDAQANQAASGDVELISPNELNEGGYLDKDPLPQLGEEEWAFIDALPEYSVEVDVPEQTDSDRQYIMQCGSFRTSERAQELRAKLAFQGLEAEVLQSDGQNGRWYRVVLGPYERKRAAERDRHQLRRAKVNGCKIY